ncbi:NADPH:quinone reductase-like Zn-dependent oxidoreductase [Bacillus mesophilus]|uniref:NADP-dependent oxidoreductase n=1 Tax=Bacillus mesophilus TaxID=1808955 RepID=A0A6M0Q4A4_9BACI|nr:NADP-dependent oxidoreductase [Bacillus mesophilus]MBM7661319.1 NADPH:quinone reductase-like Zn-dependent oxidoreductase [Bacillus mesophilus]NEY71161.1 NADP-dependent oxidoreductase [Bacillus mesophilus]
MKAIAIEKYGSSQALSVHQLPLHELGPKEIRIEVYAASVNPVDLAIRNGWLQGRITYSFPLVLGWDVAGVVSEIGSEVTHFKVGDQVYSYPDLSKDGAYAEYITVHEALVSLKPRNISFLEAASLPLVGVCAYRSLLLAGNLKKGENVLILGGSGGVGSFAVQLAKSVGAHVTATTSTKNVEFVKNLGADVVIDYTTSDLSSFSNSFDLVFDTVDRPSFDELYDMVKENGRIVSVANFVTQADKERAAIKNIAIQFLISDPSAEILNEITILIENERIRPVIGAVFELDDAKKAHELSETKHARGKIVLEVKKGVVI